MRVSPTAPAGMSSGGFVTRWLMAFLHTRGSREGIEISSIPLLEGKNTMRHKPSGISATEFLMRTLLGGFFVLCAVTTAHAGDGRVEINQARALAGGVSPADTPGFPVTLTGNQSYVLTGSLDAGSSPGLFLPASLTAGTDNVTIDLNGFSLIGDGSESTSSGISGIGTSIEIRNGTIRGFGDRGIFFDVFTHGLVVENLRVLDNGNAGIEAGPFAVITDCYVSQNGGEGISVAVGAQVARNHVSSNGPPQIRMQDLSLAEGNLIVGGTGFALMLGASQSGPTGYQNNVIIGILGGFTVQGGVDMGGNLCNGSTTCP